jgi:hypothetical protein
MAKPAPETRAKFGNGPLNDDLARPASGPISYHSIIAYRIAAAVKKPRNLPPRFGIGDQPDKSRVL